MFVRTKDQAPVRRRPGLTSSILLQLGDASDVALSVTWVEVEPGSAQEPHHHQAQQVYVVVEGTGRMEVAGDERVVGSGSLTLIPSGAEHAIANVGEGRLVYVSAASPAVSMTALYDEGELR